MNKTFLDTSFVIALVNDKDRYFQTAQELSPIYVHDHLITTDAVLLEVGNALAKDFRPEAIQIINILRRANKTQVIEINAPLFEKALAMYQKYQDKKWGLVDGISFVVMNEFGIKNALTTDKDSVQAGFNAILRDAVS